MTHKPLVRIIAAGTVLAAALLSLGTAVLAVRAIEARTAGEVRAALVADDITWATVTPDGTQIHLSGTAPNEADRFRALSAAGRVMDGTLVLDEIEVTPSLPLDAPQFTVELLRNESGISVIGLIPREIGRAPVVAELEKIAKNLHVTEMLQTADHEVPPDWQAAVEFGMEALKRLERSKISITAESVAVTAVSDSAQEKAKVERELRRVAPEGLTVLLDISAPRPVIVPFTLRFRMDATGARFDACAAESRTAADRILAAARAAGMTARADCEVGLGAPAADWADAVVTGIAAVVELGGGTLTFSDADVSLVALPDTDARLFDTVAGALEANLPEVFALKAVLPPSESAQSQEDGAGPREFIATLSPEGLVQLRGRIPDTLSRTAAASYARDRFGREQVKDGLRLDPDLPTGWPLRVLAGLEALAQLRNGALVVTPRGLNLRGLSEVEDTQARVTRILTDRLGEDAALDIDIAYRAPPEPAETGPTPEQCVAQIEAIVAEQKIIFAPGSTRIEGAAVRVIDRIADVLRACPDARIEIGGHTDSQGREEMNLTLSQQRADAVLTALIARRVLTSNLTAKGYGETQPIADNDTEEGREANRRIAFRLLPPPDAAAPGQEDDAEDTTRADPDATAQGEPAAGDDNAADTPPEDGPSQGETPKASPTDESPEAPAPDTETETTDGQD
ncbi:OmpA family protein [Rhodovulum adriaticum]|uniref:OOP family OmpA-OmpF porin n=1 Tax=Rhodovulum adriaticum TaxID=35804 RepID=A0A4R2NIW4_RHOAD|nr:OmpA family protein [Rhodovulum adriaticum]MBK1636639.1 hypothetical protein [Rhodovulum adriaticum]TCP21377.1 OOP family OmpA-OmpF porin [Rhodovulum adriaticum]